MLSQAASARKNRFSEPPFIAKAHHVGRGLPVSRELAEANGSRPEVQAEARRPGSALQRYLPIYWERT